MVTLAWYSTAFRTTVQLPLSAGWMVMFWSLLSDITAFLSLIVRLEGDAFVLESAADTFNLSCSAVLPLSFFSLWLILLL